jgi:hypothetical protein
METIGSQGTVNEDCRRRLQGLMNLDCIEYRKGNVTAGSAWVA